MDFGVQYLTYEDYEALGGTLDQSPFNVLEFEARRRIDINTQNRLKDSEEIPREVKLCEFELINCIEKYISSSEESKGNIASESIDGYSISYITLKDVSSVVNSEEVEINNIIRTYLLGVIYEGEHLLYRGIK